VASISEIHVVDSHTAGEPTRVVVAGGPELGNGPLAERLRRFAAKHDDFRSAVVNEPRGSDVLVGALLVEPVDAACIAGVLFFNNVGYLGMCGHGVIGLVTTLAHLGRIEPGEHQIETPVGVVRAMLHNDGRVMVENVPSYRCREAVAVAVAGFGEVTGDVAWGGNWFFLTENAPLPLTLENREALTSFASETAAGICPFSLRVGRRGIPFPGRQQTQCRQCDGRRFCPQDGGAQRNAAAAGVNGLNDLGVGKSSLRSDDEHQGASTGSS